MSFTSQKLSALFTTHSIHYSLFLLLNFLWACGQNSQPICTQKTAISLLDSVFQSYTSVDEFQTRYSYINTTRVQSQDYPPNGKCEGYSYTTINARYKHQGIDGELIINFYNNQLCSVAFLPPDSTQYLKILCQQSQICLDAQAELFNNKALIRKANIAEKGFAVIWEDHCIMQELNGFILRCS